MTLFPISLKLAQKPTIVIGGGKIAERKILSLLKAEAQVTVISPNWTEKIDALIQTEKIKGIQRYYTTGDLMGAFLVIAATNNPTANALIYKESQERGLLINCIDDPSHCDFYFPAIVQKGDLQVTISTNGKAPILAKKLQEALNGLAYDDMEADLEAIYDTRKKLIMATNGNETKKIAIFETDLLPLIDKLLQKLMLK